MAVGCSDSVHPTLCLLPSALCLHAPHPLLPFSSIPQGISYAICYDATGEPSGQQVQKAVQEGGPQAMAATYALLRDSERACGTSNPGAADRAYQHAVAAAAGQPGDFNLVKG